MAYVLYPGRQFLRTKGGIVQLLLSARISLTPQAKKEKLQIRVSITMFSHPAKFE